MRTWIRRLDLELLARLSVGRSSFRLDGKSRTLFGATSIIVGMSFSLSSALANVEEAPSQDPIASDYTHHALPAESIKRLVIDNYGGLTGSDLAAHYSLLNNTSYGPALEEYKADASTNLADNYRQTNTMESFGSVYIPDAVWTLDGSTGTYLYNVSNWVGSQLDARYDITDSWSSIALWTAYNPNISSDQFNISSSKFQISGCPETNSLDNCEESNSLENKRANNLRGGTPDIDSDSAIDSTSTPSQVNQADTFHNPSPLIPTGINNFLLQGGSLTAIQDQCDDMYVVCEVTEINLLTSFIDSPAGPIDLPTAITIPLPEVPDDETPPDRVINYIDDSTSVPDPPLLSTQPIITAPVPELSTEIMTIIGFITMSLFYKKKNLSSIRQGVARKLYKSGESFILRHFTQRPVV